mgnify:CR=1 FL=1
MLKRILIFLLALCCCVPAFADTYQGYNYDAWGESVPAPQSYLPTHSITLNETGKALKNPSDVFVWQEKLIYISDSGNNRIVVLDADYQLLQEIAAYESDEGSVALKNPTGIFVDQAGLLYICLPDEGRVVVLDEGNRLVREYGRPESDLLEENTVYERIYGTLFNGVIVGAVVHFAYAPVIPLPLCMLSVALGEAVACMLLGPIVLRAVRRIPSKMLHS